MSQYQAFPGGTPEFRLVQKDDGTLVQQVRYVFGMANYVGKWMDVPVVKEISDKNVGVTIG
jgi:hypothetical protein